jgi:hypothetical protein
VGLVRFNLLDEDHWESFDDAGRSGYWVLPIEPQMNAGRTIGPGTLLWWIGQIRTGHPDTAEIFSPMPQLLDLESGQFHEDVEEIFITRLFAIKNFMSDADYLWGKPAHFDCPKIESLLNQFGVHMPIPWYKYRCMTSAKVPAQVFNVTRPKPKTVGNVNHNALWDAKKQVLELQEWFRNMKS